uniref:Uncharacterized protein n=1 Tax=Arundo donax TaxID=35708 RepID=A0A0A9AYJ5_ARUDO
MNFSLGENIIYHTSGYLVISASSSKRDNA